MYAKVIDGEVVQYPYALDELRAENPNVSFPKNPNDEALAAFDLVRVKQLPPSVDFNPLTQYLSPGTPELKEEEEEEWVCGWDVIDRPVQAATAAVRARRDAILATTDWIVTKSMEDNKPVPSKYIVYRQALRDLPDQEGFPYSIEWPVLAS